VSSFENVHDSMHKLDDSKGGGDEDGGGCDESTVSDVGDIAGGWAGNNWT